MNVSGYETKELRNLSPSRIEAFNVCVMKLFYESLFKDFQWAIHPGTLVGKIIHAACEELLQKMLENGALPLEELDVVVKSWKNRAFGMFNGTSTISGIESLPIQWLYDRELTELGPEQQLKLIAERKGKQAHAVGSAVRAFYYLCSAGTTAVKLDVEQRIDCIIPSSVNPGVKVKLIGYIDLLAHYLDGSKAVFDWKTGSKKNLTKKIADNTQMLVYSHYVYETYGVMPSANLVSLEVYPSDFAEKGLTQLQKMLLKDPFLIKVDVNYQEQIADFYQEASEIWYVLSTLINPPVTEEEKRIAAEFQPKSHNGRLKRYERHVRAGRPVPNVGCMACEYCPAKALCQKDNKDDWENYFNHQKQIQLHSEDVSEKELADEVKQQIKPLPQTGQLRLFPELPLTKEEKRQARQIDSYNWHKTGFVKINKQSSKAAKKVFSLVPRHWTGDLCPCKQGEWLWSELLDLHPQVAEEEKQYKDQQRADRKSGKLPKGSKLKPLLKSKHIERKVTQCPIAKCPHRCNPDPRVS